MQSYGFAVDLYGFAVDLLWNCYGIVPIFILTVRPHQIIATLLCGEGGGAINCDGITVCGPWLVIALNWPG